MGHDKTDDAEQARRTAPDSVTIATDTETEGAIRQVMEQVPLANRHAVCRAALRAGIRLLVEDPSRTIGLLREQTVRVMHPRSPQKEGA